MSEKIVTATRLMDLAQECEERQGGFYGRGESEDFYRDIVISIRELLLRRTFPTARPNNDGFMELPSLRA